VPTLLLGPVLRHVDETSTSGWVETDQSGTVEVLGTSERTWCVAGHHYALLCGAGLAPGSTRAYEVRLDGHRVWPEPDSRFPPSYLRTLDPGREVRLVFGSCRYASPRGESTEGKSVPPLPLSWDRVAGPFFGNQLATLTLAGRSARLLVERVGPVGGAAGLAPVLDIGLA
jgi:hypothetical protein